MTHPELPSGNYNAGFENISIKQLAKMIACKTGAPITTTPSNDPRSYRQNSDKLLNTGFKPLFSIGHAVDELSNAFATGELVDSEQSHTVKWMVSSAWPMDNNHQATQRFQLGREVDLLEHYPKANATSPRGAIKRQRAIVKLPADLAKHFLMAIDDTVTVAFTTIHDFGSR